MPMTPEERRAEWQEMQAKGIDYDLRACLEYNAQPFDIPDIERVLAVVEGERDEAAWHWLLKLSGDRYAYLTGRCDYTGWD